MLAGGAEEPLVERVARLVLDAACVDVARCGVTPGAAGVASATGWLVLEVVLVAGDIALDRVAGHEDVTVVVVRAVEEERRKLWQLGQLNLLPPLRAVVISV